MQAVGAIEQELKLDQELIVSLVKRGQLKELISFAEEFIQSYNNFEDDFTEIMRDECRRMVINAVKKQIISAISALKQGA
ncbi:hypothetical protein [Paenibacillus sp. GXUN7292]|uniref:hypothetical protein n=1 Tax=Paenibacillus sp. GXUN7292 TaxID=3422499 RepID=UPI003D7C8C93